MDIAVVGAGPAGLSAATAAVEAGLSVVLFERKEIANTIFDYQLRKHVMAEPQRLPLRALIPFEAGTRESILQAWNESLARYGVCTKRADVTAVKKSADIFVIQSSEGEVKARHVVMAIGVQGTPNRLKVPGAEQPHVTYTLKDPELFEGQNMVVVGAGDAAIENALALCEKNSVTLLNQSDDFPRAKEANASKILNAIKSGHMKMQAQSQLVSIGEKSIVVHGGKGDLEIPCDHLIARIGGTLPRKFLETCGIEFPSADPQAVPRVNGHYESSVKGLYIVGALIGYPLIKQGLNQGYEVVQSIRGQPLVPADQILVDETLKSFVVSEQDESAIADSPTGARPRRDKLSALRAQCPLFVDLSEAQFRELVIESKIHHKESGQIVFQRNDYTDTFFSVISGELEIEIPDGRLVKIAQGQFFGEMGLLSGRRRVATVRASSRAVLLESPRKQILKLMKSVPSVKAQLDQIFILRILQSTVFPDTDPHFLQDLVTKARLKNFKKNEDLFREGEIGDFLYVIRKGSVKVSKISALGSSLTISYVAAGNVVGEMALLSFEDCPRSATVTAAVPTETIVIEKKDFQSLLEKNPRVREKIESLANTRRVQNIRNDEREAVGAGALLDFMAREGVTDADNILVIDSNRCVGCDYCEKACAATHGGTSRLDRKGGKSFASIQVPISCRHCENPLCMTDCPPDALTRLSNGEVVILDSCIGCGNCVHNCPYGVIQLVPEKPHAKTSFLWEWLGFGERPATQGAKKAAKCDLCKDLKGGPACVRSCPTGAALRLNPQDLIHSLGEES